MLEKRHTEGYSVRNEEKDQLLVFPVGKKENSNTCIFVTVFQTPALH